MIFVVAVLDMKTLNCFVERLLMEGPKNITEVSLRGQKISRGSKNSAGPKPYCFLALSFFVGPSLP